MSEPAAPFPLTLTPPKRTTAGPTAVPQLATSITCERLTYCEIDVARSVPPVPAPVTTIGLPTSAGANGNEVAHVSVLDPRAIAPSVAVTSSTTRIVLARFTFPAVAARHWTGGSATRVSV